MDDDLLADDDQFKDDGLEDLDRDEEAALLGLSDEEIEDSKDLNDEDEGADLEYVDEDGNHLDIGENNAHQYEMANVQKLRSSPEEDILDIDLDGDIDSFMQDDPETQTKEPSPIKLSNEKRNTRNLISLTSRKSSDARPFERRESVHSPVKEIETSNINIAYVSKGLKSSHTPVEAFKDDLEFDEESEDENVADDHRERFKSERNIITLTPAKKRSVIPDNLESVINVEETAKVQAFLENEQRKKMRFKGRPLPRMKSATFTHHTHPFEHSLQHQAPPTQFASPSGPPSQVSSNTTQSRKILINPHFRGPRAPPPNTQPQTHDPNPMHVPSGMPPYEQPPPQNILPPPTAYSHHETMPPATVPAPLYSAPPPSAPTYNQPDYPPPQPMPQAPPPIWQAPPPEIPPPVSYSNPPPPVLNYTSPPPNYNNYNNQYQNTNFQIPPPTVPPPPQPAPYSQPPPPIHMPTYSSPPISSVSTNVTHMQYSNNQPSFQQNNLQEPYNQQMNLSQHPPHVQEDSYGKIHVNQSSHQQNNQSFQQTPNSKPFQQNARSNLQNRVGNQQNRGGNQQNRVENQHFRKQNQPFQNQQQNQRFNRPAEKRLSHSNMQEIPMKQARYESPQSKKTHNPNIREIPLVDTLPYAAPKKETKPSISLEEEDEQTKELRLKIEEQKRLREQILKQKEERRRQMAAQRMMEVKQRQNNILVVQKTETPLPLKQPVIPPAQPKLSAKERIGIPGAKAEVAAPVAKERIAVTGAKGRVGVPMANKRIEVLSAKERIAAPMANKRIEVLSAKERIGVPISSTEPTPKKKIIVLKRKPLQATNVVAQPVSAQPKQVITPKPNLENQGNIKSTKVQVNDKLLNIEGVKQSAPIKQAAQPSVFQKKKIIVLKRNAQVTKTQTPVGHPPIKNNAADSNEAPKKASVLSRLGPRPVFQKRMFRNPNSNMQQMRQRHSPRFQRRVGPRNLPPQQPLLNDDMAVPHDRPPVMEMPPHVPFHEQRPPLLPFGPPRERPPMGQFMFDDNSSQFRPQGPNDLNRPPFHMQEMHDMNRPQFHPQGPGEFNGPPFHPPNHHDMNHPQFCPQNFSDPNRPPFHPRERPPNFSHQQFHGPEHGGPAGPQFHPRGPGFPNFRPRGMDMYPQERFRPHHVNQNQQRPMHEQNHRMFRPRFHPSPKHRSDRPNFNQQKPQAVKNDVSSPSEPVSSEPYKPKEAPKDSIPTGGVSESPKVIQEQPVVPSTNVVSVGNLSSTTNESQLRKLCASVGVVQSIKLVKGERKAIITFKEALQAANFQKKYQRFMLDLSMIQVSLVST